MIRIFIGFDSRETIAYHVLSQSIISKSSKPVSITPICLHQLKHCFYRKKHPLQSTEFSFSRFLVPFLCDYKGWALFLDCDMLLLEDISKLWDKKDDKYSLMLVKHDYKTKYSQKFLKQKQTNYAKKNWSSVMLFNNARCKALSKDYVNTASGLQLHQFNWLDSEEEIGELPFSWNFLVDEYKQKEKPNLL